MRLKISALVCNKSPKVLESIAGWCYANHPLIKPDKTKLGSGNFKLFLYQVQVSYYFISLVFYVIYTLLYIHIVN